MVICSYSDWGNVTTPGQCIMGPLLFLIYINDLVDCCEIYSEIYLFADDAKLFYHILHASNHCSLQSGINKLLDWTQNWLLKININKCKVFV